jgi:hypothetical protein
MKQVDDRTIAAIVVKAARERGFAKLLPSLLTRLLLLFKIGDVIIFTTKPSPPAANDFSIPDPTNARQRRNRRRCPLEFGWKLVEGTAWLHDTLPLTITAVVPWHVE